LTAFCPENRNPHPKEIFKFLSVTDSESQPDFVCPNPFQLLGIALSEDTQTPPQQALF
jgi:hypothetical protein